MNFGALQNLCERTMIVQGEYLVLVLMIDDPLRPYSLALQVINPLRLKTPVDLLNNPSIKDGVELGLYGEPVAYWIKKSPASSGVMMLPDTSGSFVRVPARQGHRLNVIHGFITTSPEQVRALPASTPALKFFRDLGDYLDAELVSNIVTAAFSMFIELKNPTNPYGVADGFATYQSSRQVPSGNTEETRYQEMIPGTPSPPPAREPPSILSPRSSRRRFPWPTAYPSRSSSRTLKT
jgi:capsid protein